MASLYAWYDLGDKNTMTTDFGLTKVQNPGDIVAVVFNKATQPTGSGAGGVIAQTGASSLRPKYQVDGQGRSFLEFDGVDDSMNVAFPQTLPKPVTFCVTCRPAPNAAAATAVCVGGPPPGPSGDVSALTITAAGVVNLFAGQALVGTATNWYLPGQVQWFATVVGAGATGSEVWENGVQVAVGDSETAGPQQVIGISLGSNIGPGLFYRGGIYEVRVFQGRLAADEMAFQYTQMFGKLRGGQAVGGGSG